MKLDPKSKESADLVWNLFKRGNEYNAWLWMVDDDVFNQRMSICNGCPAKNTRLNACNEWPSTVGDLISRCLSSLQSLSKFVPSGSHCANVVTTSFPERANTAPV